MQNYVLVYLQNVCDLAEYIKPQDPDPVTSLHPSDQVALIYKTSTERMKGERGHLNQQQLITEQIHIFLIFCGI